MPPPHAAARPTLCLTASTSLPSSPPSRATRTERRTSRLTDSPGRSVRRGPPQYRAPPWPSRYRAVVPGDTFVVNISHVCRPRRRIVDPLATVSVMRAVFASTPGGPEVLEVREVAMPIAGPGEVVIDVAASAVNRADLMQRAGHYPPPPGASDVLGLECSGIVAARGPDTDRFEVGDQVCALLSSG